MLSPAATLQRLPYLQNVQTSHASVLWTTTEKGVGTVEYSVDTSYSSSVTAQVREFSPAETGLSESFYQYQADLTALSAGTTYNYRVLVDGEAIAPSDGSSGEYVLQTAGSGKFTFLAFGDSGTGSAAQGAIAKLILAENPALILHMGDVINLSGTFQQLQSYYFDYYASLLRRVPIFPTPGNHDYMTDSAAPYLAVHAPPTTGVPTDDAGRYYSFNWSNVHFVSLDSNLLSPSAASARMLAWLESDLAATRKFWRVAYFHHAPYATGLHADDPLAALARANVLPILENYGVQLVLSGHEHSYQRTVTVTDGAAVAAGSGTMYFITGGGGASLATVGWRSISAVAKSAHNYLRVEVAGAQMTVHAIGIDGQEIEQVTLAPLPKTQASAVVNSATYTTTLAPGSLVSIFGKNLATEDAQAGTFPLPTTLSGTSVEWNGQQIPLLYVSSNQVNAQLPYGSSGSNTLRVRTAEGAAAVTVSTADIAPAILTGCGDTGLEPAVVHASSGTLVSSTSPAIPGEYLSVYAIGLGPVSGTLAAGEAAPVFPLLSTQAEVQASIGGVTVPSSFAGLAPGFAGLYQVNVAVPSGLASGSHLLRLVVAGIGSNTVTVPIDSETASSQ